MPRQQSTTLRQLSLLDCCGQERLTSWLHESAEGGGLEGPPMGTRFFQYDPKADTVSMTVSDANGAFHTLTWPWQSIFMELWARDHVC